MLVPNAAALAHFTLAKMTKVELASAALLYAGLNCFEPGQEHAAHIHADQDKLYYAIEGEGEVTIGPATQPFRAGDLALAPAGVEHALRNTGAARLIVLTVFAPPPKR